MPIEGLTPISAQRLPNAKLATLIGMVNHRFWPTCGDRHIQRSNHQVRCHLLTKCPTHHFAAVHINHHSQIDKARPSRQVGYVSHPQLVNVRSCKLPPDQVERYPLGFVAPGGDAPVASPANAAQTGQAHQPLDALEVDDFTRIHKLGADAVSAIGVVTHLVDQANGLSHDLIVTGPFAGRAATPVVVAAGGDMEVFAHGLRR